MKTKAVSLKKVCESPTFCLNPLRYFDECHRCDVFTSRVAGIRRRVRQQGGDTPVEGVIDEAVDGLKCRPKLRSEIVELLKRKERILAELRGINEKLGEAGKPV